MKQLSRGAGVRVTPVFLLLALFLLVAAGVLVCAPPAAASTEDGVVEFIVFDAEDCYGCEFLNGLLERLDNEYGPGIKYDYYLTSDFENFKKMVDIENAHGRTDMAHPQVYIGGQALIGESEISSQLGELVGMYARQGGVDMPRIPESDGQDGQSPTGEDNPVYIAYFYESACRECDAVALELDYIEEYSPLTSVREYNISTGGGLEMNEAMGEAMGVQEEKRGVAPAVFVGNHYLAGDSLNRKELNKAIEESREEPEPVVPWERAQDKLDDAREGIEERFNTIGVLTVLGAGLVDGVNPCAFTVLVFLVAYLAFTGREGKEVIYVGGAFTLTVFLTYLLIGVGLLSFVRAVGVSGTAGKWITVAVASLSAAFGVFAIYDYVKARSTGKAESTLGLTAGVTRRIHKAVREHTRTRSLVLGAIVLGIVITVMELGCTGQVYLPTITFVARSGDDRLRAILYLVMYCFMFIVPLVVVFLLVFFGTSQEKLVAFGKKHAMNLKLTGGLVLLGLSALLFITV